MKQPADMEGILKITKFPRAQLFGLRRDGTGRHVVGATFEEAAQGSLCESIRAGQIVDHALRLYATEEVGRWRCVVLCYLLFFFLLARLEGVVAAASSTWKQSLKVYFRWKISARKSVGTARNLIQRVL